MTTISRYRALRWSLFKGAEGDALPLHAVQALLSYPPDIHHRATADRDPSLATLHLSTFTANSKLQFQDHNRVAQGREVPAPSNWTPEGYTGNKGQRYAKFLGHLSGVKSIHMAAYANPHDPDSPGLAHVPWDEHATGPATVVKHFGKQYLPRYYAEYGSSRGQAGRVARADMMEDVWQHANHDHHIYSQAMQHLAGHILDHDPSHEHDAVALGGTLMPVRLGDLANGSHLHPIRQGKGTVTGFTQLYADGSDYKHLGTDQHVGSAMDQQVISHIPVGNHIPQIAQELGNNHSTHLIHVPTSAVFDRRHQPIRSIPDHGDGAMWTKRSMITRSNVLDLGEHMRKMVNEGEQYDFPHQFFAPRQYGDQE